MASNNYHIEVTFPESERDLYEWTRLNGRSNFAYFVRQALECLRLFGSLDRAKQALEALEREEAK